MTTPTGEQLAQLVIDPPVAVTSQAVTSTRDPVSAYPAIVRAVSDRTRNNPRHSKVSRSTTERIMTAIAAGVAIDRVDDPQVPPDVRPFGLFGRHLVEVVVREWRAVIADQAAALVAAERDGDGDGR